MIRFTVIIVTRDRPQFLARAIASVRAQTYPHYELLVVDNGSTPPVDPGTATHRLPPSDGPGPARALGLAHATGDYVCFLDDDDQYLPHHLETLAPPAALRNAQSQTLLTTGILINRSQEEPTPAGHYTNDRDFLPQYWNRPTSLLPFALPRALAQNTPMYPGPSPIEDFAWLSYLLARAPACQLPEYTVLQTHHANMRSTVLTDETSLRARLETVRWVYQTPEIQARVSPEHYRKMQFHQATHWARQSGRWLGLRQAMKYFNWRSGWEFLRTVRTLMRRDS